MASTDGKYWRTGDQHFITGLPTAAAISPATNLNDNRDKVYDAIVVGAGYAGLTAGRDLANAVLLLEGRDRVGGRTWSADVNGHTFEMGGAWLSWNQAHIWREISRYGMQDELLVTNDHSHQNNYCTLVTANGSSRISHTDEDEMCKTVLEKLFNIDSNHGKKVMQFPHSEDALSLYKMGDDISIKERVRQIRHELSEEEDTILNGFLILCTGGDLENISFHELLHWWALGGHDYSSWMTSLRDYTLKNGQSQLALQFFNEALQSGNFDYALGFHVLSIIQKNGLIYVRAEDKEYIGRSLVLAIPLTKLADITFEPPLIATKQLAFESIRQNKTLKLNYECEGSDLRSWTSVAHSEEILSCAFGQSLLENENTVVVAYLNGDLYHKAELTPILLRNSLRNLHHVNVKALVYHDWNEDEFSKGSWFFPQVGYVQRHLDALRQPQGRIHFASSDWARGWRGYIDGAIEEGTRAAKNILSSI